MIAGKGGNIPTLAINAVYGTALYVRNLTAFTGGKDSYTMQVATAQDVQLALTLVRTAIIAQQARTKAILASPCGEMISRQLVHIQLVVSCQYVLYNVPSYMRVVSARLVDKNFLVDVVFIARPMLVRTRFSTSR
jgi:hypothetical protein